MFELFFLIFYIIEMIRLVCVVKHCLRGAAEEVGESEVDGVVAVFSDETQTLVIGSFTYLIIRSAFSECCLLDYLCIFFLD